MSITINIPKLITPKSTFNVFGFGILDWVIEERWSLISKQRINGNSAKEVNSNNGEIIEHNLFKLFIQNTNFVRTNIQPNV
jgi:hypothetical protein